MPEEQLILVLGGGKSGKSELAEEMARDSGRPVVYLATGRVLDQEFAQRVAMHRQRRPAAWRTVEEPLNLAEAVKEIAPEQVILVDSLGTWVSNWLYRDGNFEAAVNFEDPLRAWKDFLAAAQASRQLVIAVGDETGLGLVPPTPEGRLFRDLNGRINQLAARYADRVYLVAAGIPIQIKQGEPK